MSGSGGKGTKEEDKGKDLLARYIANFIVSSQCKAVSILQNWERRLNTRQKKIGILVFTLLGIAYLLLLFKKVVTENETSKPAIDFQHMPPPFIPPLNKLSDTVKQ